MEARIQKWGNSHAIRIPKIFIDELKLKDNERVILALSDEGIIIKKITPKKQLNLQDYLEKYYNKPLCDIELNAGDEVVNWGEPRGEEEW